MVDIFSERIAFPPVRHCVNITEKFLSDMATSLNMPTFEPVKLFIKPCGQPEADWKELTTEIISDSITITKETPDSHFPTRFSFTATINFTRKNRIRLLQTVGLMKRPRCTYKTIKRDCAKRNRYL